MIHQKLEANVGNVIGNMVGTIQKIEHSDNMRDPMKMWRFKSNSNWSKKMTTIKRNSLQEIPKLNWGWKCASKFFLLFLFGGDQSLWFSHCKWKHSHYGHFQKTNKWSLFLWFSYVGYEGLGKVWAKVWENVII